MARPGRVVQIESLRACPNGWWPSGSPPCAGAPAPDLAGRPVVLVDDGLASGFTLLAAVEACRRAGAEALVVAVPTGHRRAADRVAAEVDSLYCANLRSQTSFAVASAYRHWRDVPEQEAAALLAEQGGP